MPIYCEKRLGAAQI